MPESADEADEAEEVLFLLYLLVLDTTLPPPKDPVETTESRLLLLFVAYGPLIPVDTRVLAVEGGLALVLAVEGGLDGGLLGVR